MGRNRFTLRQVVFAAAAVIIFMLLADFNNRLNEKQRLTAQHEQVAAQLAELEAIRMVLESQIEYARSDAAVEAWAYQEGGLVRPGDFVIVPQPAPGEALPEEPAPATTTEPKENWEVWWSMFFDE